MPNLIETRGLCRRFGKTIALDGIAFSARASSAHGLVGPDGAGKTTLLRILAGVLAPTSGEARIAGLSAAEDVAGVRAATGFLPNEFGLYPHMSVSEYLVFFAACHGVPTGDQLPLVSDLLQLVDLSHRRDTAVEELSAGMRKRLGLARALTHDPRVLLLDEPLTGLDPKARVEIRELIRELRTMGKTVLMTSRNMAELEGVCDTVTLMERGRIVDTGEFGALTNRLRPHRPVVVTFLGESEAALEVANRNPGVFDARLIAPPTQAGAPALVSEMRLKFDGNYYEASALLSDLLRAGTQVVSFVEHADSLEAMFETAGDGIA